MYLRVVANQRKLQNVFFPTKNFYDVICRWPLSPFSIADIVNLIKFKLESSFLHQHQLYHQKKKLRISAWFHTSFNYDTPLRASINLKQILHQKKHNCSTTSAVSNVKRIFATIVVTGTSLSPHSLKIHRYKYWQSIFFKSSLYLLICRRLINPITLNKTFNCTCRSRNL
jgi:hypothetical protein